MQKKKNNLPPEVVIIGNKPYSVYITTILLRFMDEDVSIVRCIANYRNEPKLERIIKILSYYGIKEDDRTVKTENYYQVEIKLRY